MPIDKPFCPVSDEIKKPEQAVQKSTLAVIVRVPVLVPKMGRDTHVWDERIRWRVTLARDVFCADDVKTRRLGGRSKDRREGSCFVSDVPARSLRPRWFSQRLHREDGSGEDGADAHQNAKQTRPPQV